MPLPSCATPGPRHTFLAPQNARLPRAAHGHRPHRHTRPKRFARPSRQDSVSPALARHAAGHKRRVCDRFCQHLPDVFAHHSFTVRHPIPKSRHLAGPTRLNAIHDHPRWQKAKRMAQRQHTRHAETMTRPRLRLPQIPPVESTQSPGRQAHAHRIDQNSKPQSVQDSQKKMAGIFAQDHIHTLFRQTKVRTGRLQRPGNTPTQIVARDRRADADDPCPPLHPFPGRTHARPTRTRKKCVAHEMHGS